jgi:hypothetical protein
MSVPDALLAARHIRDVLYNTTLANVRRTHDTLARVVAGSQHPLLHFATRCIWSAYAGLLASTLVSGRYRLAAVYAALPFARVGTDGDLVAGSVLGSAVALSEGVGEHVLCLRERNAVKCAVVDITAAFLAQCAAHDAEEHAASREAVQQAAFGTLTKGKMQPDVDAVCATLRRAFALDNADVVGSLRRTVDLAAAFRASLLPLKPAVSGLACALHAVCALPGLSPPLADALRSVDVSAAVACVHAAGAAASHTIDVAAHAQAVYGAAHAAWRDGLAGMQRLVLDALVLVHFTGNAACARHVLRRLLLSAPFACAAYSA